MGQLVAQSGHVDAEKIVRQGPYRIGPEANYRVLSGLYHPTA